MSRTTRPQITIGAYAQEWRDAQPRVDTDLADAFRGAASAFGGLAWQDFRAWSQMHAEGRPHIELTQESAEEIADEVRTEDTSEAVERAGRRVAELERLRREGIRAEVTTAAASAGRRLRELGNQDPVDGEPSVDAVGLGGSSPSFPANVPVWARLAQDLAVQLEEEAVVLRPIDTVTEVSINNTAVEVSKVQPSFENSFMNGPDMVTINITARMTRQEYDRIMESTNSEQKALDEPKGRKMRA